MIALTPTVSRLVPFVSAGVLSEADVALVVQLLDATQISGATGDVLLGAALAVRAPRLGNVCVVLSRVAAEVVPDEDAAAVPLEWPEPRAWREALASSKLVADPARASESPRRPFVLDGERLYISRLWHDEVLVADRLRQLAADGDRLTIITGGPGTGKTTRVATELIALLSALSPDEPFRIALSAPTGKAASRLKDVLSAALAQASALDAVIARAESVTAQTLHKLLGSNPRRLDARFTYHAAHPLPFDLVIVDEVSMVSLPLLARTLDAIGPQTRLMLVGDPDQLASVEAGCVLADIVGGRAGVIAPRLTQLTTSYRFTSESWIGRVAAAIRDGDADATMALLREAPSPSGWVDPGSAAYPQQRRFLTTSMDGIGRGTRDFARAGNVDAALDSLVNYRTLCAHRTGDWGVSTWNDTVERLMQVDRAEPWYIGRPVLVQRNDSSLGLMNGDLGVVVHTPVGPRVAFGTGGADVRLVAPVRLESVETAHVMTIHKSQGSEFGHVNVIMPPSGSRMLTRELLYTAVTRARRSVAVVGTEAAIRSAVGRRAARASGLGERL
jgi:exodeoxyribonuclease V alpha subunit